MKKSVMVSAAAAFAVVAALVGVARAQKETKVIYVSSEKATYTALMDGVSQQVLMGEPDKGPHATFSKFAPGYDAGMHSHTSDISIVVVKGAYLYKDEAGEKRVAAGEYLFVPGGHKHWSGGDKKEGAVFYEQGSGKFDTVPVK